MLQILDEFGQPIVRREGEAEGHQHQSDQVPQFCNGLFVYVMPSQHHLLLEASGLVKLRHPLFNVHSE